MSKKMNLSALGFLGMLVLLLAASAALALGQEAAVTTTSPVSVVPHLIKFSGALPGAPGKAEAVDIKFSLYAAQTGGEALWTETQQVALDAAGKYSVLLGSSVALPSAVFANGQARWIGVTLGSEQESPRTVLVATPYSLKASDSETLGGHPASDFTLKNAQSPSGTDITQINVGNGVTGGGTGPTVTLGLSSSYLESLGNGIYPQLTGTNVLSGKNTYSAGKLFIGSSPVLSAANIVAGADINLAVSGSNVTIGVNGPALLSLGNGYYPQLTANNSFSGTNAFSKAITFASGQTFPGTATLAGNNTFSGTNTFSKAITFASGQTFPGVPTLGGNDAFTGLITVTGSSTSTSGGIITAFNTESTGSGSAVWGQMTNGEGAAVYGWGSTGVYGATNSAASSGDSPIGVYGTVSSTYTNSTGYSAIGVWADNELSGYGLYATTPDGIGVYASAGLGDGVAGVTGDPAGYGVYGGNDNSSATGAGVYGTTNSIDGYGVQAIGVGTSQTGTYWSGNGFGAALWADSNVDSSAFYGTGAILATTDNLQAAVMANNSADAATLYVENSSSGGTYDYVPVIAAVGTKGACGINGTGDVTCSGRLRTAVPLSGSSQQVEVYSVQSSENWFEDFGSAKLSSGSATVAIDSQFAQIVNTGVEYHVFLTPKGESENLYIVNESSSGFEVREAHGGKSNIAFDYRIVAKRTGHETERLADATAEMQGLTKMRDTMAAKRATMHITPKKMFVPPAPRARAPRIGSASLQRPAAPQSGKK